MVERAPPGCVLTPPLPTPDWAFWHLCVHTAQAPPPGAGAGLRPVPAPHVSTAHILAVTLRETPVPRVGTKVWGSHEVRFCTIPPSPSLRSAVCRPRGLLHPAVAFQQPIAFLPKRRILKQQPARLTSTSCSYSSSTNTFPGHSTHLTQPLKPTPGFHQIFRV